MYMFSPKQEAGENIEWVDTWAVANLNWWEEVLVLPEIDPENPDSTNAPIVVTDDWENDEMDQTIQIQLENGETEVVRQWDLWDAIQVN